MPDCVDLIDSLIKFPNMALVSLAGNLPGHMVKTLDLVVCGRRVGDAARDAMRRVQPRLVGLSAMTFQFDSLLKTAELIRREFPGVLVAAGGYHATLMAEELTMENPALPVDFLIRGEGERTMRELCDAVEAGGTDFSGIPGLSYRDKAGAWRHNPPRPIADPADIAPPDRAARLRQDFQAMGSHRWDSIETSRGCPNLCKFCSITRMYGRTFRKYSMERIAADLDRIRSLGFDGAFIVDDNITHDIDHFLSLCHMIKERGFNSLMFSAQLAAAPIVQRPEIGAAMREANFKIVFVGFESMAQEDLAAMRKPTSPDANRKAVRILRENGIAVVAGCIVGYPDDDAAAVRRNFQAIVGLKPDIIYPQYLTPYPKTVIRSELLAAGLIVNKDDYRAYDGYSCNVRTHHLSRVDLFRTLRSEMLKSYVYPSLVFGNLALRHFPLALPALGRNARNVLLNLVTGHCRPAKLIW